jgi:hypothetical protein
LNFPFGLRFSEILRSRTFGFFLLMQFLACRAWLRNYPLFATLSFGPPLFAQHGAFSLLVIDRGELTLRFCEPQLTY